jgi:cell shape-determining protein MreC
MKVRSRHNFRDEKKQRIARVFLVSVAVIGIGLLLPTLFTLVGRIVMYPVHATQQWFHESQSRLPMFLKSQNDLVNQITDLQSKLAAAESTDLTQKRLYDENFWLREQLSVDGKKRIAAAVVARPNEMPYDLLQIDRGEVDGVKIGAPVYIGADNVVGVVSQLAPHYSFVELFTTPGFTATTFISGANIVATLEGYGGGVARVKVPQGVPLKVGNLVHVPSLDPGVFGRVEYIENRPSQPEQFGYITLQKPIANINYVSVGTDTVVPVAPAVIEERVNRIIGEALVVDTTKLTFASSTVIVATTTATSTRP